MGRTPMLGQSVKSFLPGNELLNYFEAILRVYNRALSQAELAQNWLADRGTYFPDSYIVAGSVRVNGVVLTSPRRVRVHRRSDGVLLGAGGFAHPWFGRAIAWAVLSRHVRPRHFLRIDRFVRARIGEQFAAGHWRVEADCMTGVLASARWLLALGFEVEGRAKKFSPEARDFLRWAKVAA